MAKLSELFYKYRARTDKVTAHTYGDVYDQWLTPLQGRPLNILLLGVNMFGGGDIDAFNEFFPDSRIYAVDLSLHLVVTDVSYAKVEGDAYNIATHRKLRTIGFDLILDDCRHEPNAQLTALSLYYPLLKDNGRYIIEDMQRNNFELYAAAVKLAVPHRSIYLYISGHADIGGQSGNDSSLLIIR